MPAFRRLANASFFSSDGACTSFGSAGLLHCFKFAPPAQKGRPHPHTSTHTTPSRVRQPCPLARARVCGGVYMSEFCFSLALFFSSRSKEPSATLPRAGPHASWAYSRQAIRIVVPGCCGCVPIPERHVCPAALRVSIDLPFACSQATPPLNHSPIRLFWRSENALSILRNAMKGWC